MSDVILWQVNPDVGPTVGKNCGKHVAFVSNGLGRGGKGGGGQMTTGVSEKVCTFAVVQKGRKKEAEPVIMSKQKRHALHFTL